MKYTILVILAVAAVLGAMMFMQSNEPTPASKMVAQVQGAVEESVDNLKSSSVEARAEIKTAVEGLSEKVKDIDLSESIAPMEVTAYQPEFEDLAYADKDGNTHIFKIERVTKVAEIQKGLMFRREMPEDQGMLFVFPSEAERGFWMKNTYIPLDMFFIKADGAIHKVHKGAVPLDTTVIHSEGPVTYVLEVNAGVADKFGITAGDKFHHEIFINKLAE